MLELAGKIIIFDSEEKASSAFDSISSNVREMQFEAAYNKEVKRTKSIEKDLQEARRINEDLRRRMNLVRQAALDPWEEYSTVTDRMGS